MALECVAQSHSVVAASTIEGEVLFARSYTFGGSFNSTQRERLRKHLGTMLSDVASFLGVRYAAFEGCQLCIGMSGVTFPLDRETSMPRCLKQMGINIGAERLICTGDAETILVSHTRTLSGMGLLCHSGSTAFVSNDSKFNRLGGWGPMLGDEGSAHWMGMSALRYLADEYDQRIPWEDSSLWSYVDRWMSAPDCDIPEVQEASILWRRRIAEVEAGGFDPRTAVFSFLHQLERQWSVERRRQVVSKLVKPVMEAWSEGCGTAAKLVSDAARLLVGQLAALSEGLSEEFKSLPIVLYGEVFNHHPNFCELVERELSNQMPWWTDGELLSINSTGTLRPVLGGLLLASAKSTSSRYRLPESRVVENLKKTTNQFRELIND